MREAILRVMRRAHIGLIILGCGVALTYGGLWFLDGGASGAPPIARAISPPTCAKDVLLKRPRRWDGVPVEVFVSFIADGACFEKFRQTTSLVPIERADVHMRPGIWDWDWDYLAPPAWWNVDGLARRPVYVRREGQGWAVASEDDGKVWVYIWAM